MSHSPTPIRGLRLTQPDPAFETPQPLTPQQQLEAASRVRAQAEERVGLGMKLLQAAQTHTSHQQQLIEELREGQQQLRTELHTDIASSLQTYDQWMAQFDQRFSRRLRAVEQAVEVMQSKWAAVERKIVTLTSRAEVMLDQKEKRIATEAARKHSRQAKPAPVSPQAVTPPQAKGKSDDTPLPPAPDAGPIRITSSPQAAAPSADTRHAESSRPRDMVYSKALKHLRDEDGTLPSPQTDS